MVQEKSTSRLSYDLPFLNILKIDVYCCVPIHLSFAWISIWENLKIVLSNLIFKILQWNRTCIYITSMEYFLPTTPVFHKFSAENLKLESVTDLS